MEYKKIKTKGDQEMIISECLSMETPEENLAITLGEIFPAAQGNYITIKIKTEEGEKIVKGNSAKIKEKIIVIGNKCYEPDTLILGVMAITHNQEVLPCNLCPCGPCYHENSQTRDHCIEIIWDIMN